MAIFYVILTKVIVISHLFYKKSIKDILQSMKSNQWWSFLRLIWTINKFMSKKISSTYVDASLVVILDKLMS